MEELSVVSSPMQPHLTRLIENCQSSLVIASPFIKHSATEWLVRTKSPSLNKVSVLTNISLGSVLSKSLEISALRLFFDGFQTTSIVSLPYLHAKVFIADESMALVTSANFTNGGLWKNYEYGVIINGKKQVKAILGDISAYMNLGGVVLPEFLSVVEDKVTELNKKQELVESNLATKSLRKEVRQSETELQGIFLANRLRKGQTINSLFSDTILVLLRRELDGLTTQQIHADVQKIHPDICDDSIDRVVNGQHFGKRWKHYVRRAQEFLKDKDLVFRVDGKWRLRNG